MTILYSFLFCGTICLISQIIMNNSKLTFGHITSMFVVIGSFLGVFGIYDKIISIVGIGANLPIISFGNTITNSVYYGYISDGFLGIFNNLLAGVSLGISAPSLRVRVIFSGAAGCSPLALSEQVAHLMSKSTFSSLDAMK